MMAKSALMRWVINPVLNKEIKLRMRSFKSFIGIFFYLAALGLIALGFIYISTQNQTGFIRPEESRMMFHVLSYAQLGLILFMTPGLTAGVISGERERQTLNILLTTEQSSSSIIISKLFSSLSFLTLMIFASLPLYSIVFLFGGVSPLLILKTFLLYLMTIITVGSIGVFYSTIIRKTIISMIASYGTAMFLVFGTLFITMLSMMSVNTGLNQQQTTIIPYLMLMLNPGAVLFQSVEPYAMNEIQKAAGWTFPLTYSFFISYTVIAVVMLLLSIRKLRPNMKKGRKA
ncbi:ABC transporter permease [Bacillus tianshenii]|nr:ABC transporter permease [Bacillus tianshenii]